MLGLLLPIIYLSFISLGLPDALLGSAWPSMYGELGVPVSYAGVISMIIAFGTIISSLQSERLTKALGTGKVTAISVAMTAVALLGFSTSHSFIALCLWAIPYGLGAGSVDASLNNYVALHYASRHMSWLHCMWGVGASLGPYVMGYALAQGQGWNAGYRTIAVAQIVLTGVLIVCLPLWSAKAKSGLSAAEEKENGLAKEKPLPLKEIIRIPGAKEVMIAFFAYCAVEQTTGLWASSYLTLSHGITPESAASYASLFFVGITVGRLLGGFLSIKISDQKMVRIGQATIGLGIIVLLLPFGNATALAALVMIGFGCAPIYPSLIHATPAHFGADKSQAVIGVQMASAYIGTCVMPPLFGFLSSLFTVAWLPVYLGVILALMIVMHERLVKKCAGKEAASLVNGKR